MEICLSAQAEYVREYDIEIGVKSEIYNRNYDDSNVMWLEIGQQQKKISSICGRMLFAFHGCATTADSTME